MGEGPVGVDLEEVDPALAPRYGGGAVDHVRLLLPEATPSVGQLLRRSQGAPEVVGDALVESTDDRRGAATETSHDPGRRSADE